MNVESLSGVKCLRKYIIIVSLIISIATLCSLNKLVEERKKERNKRKERRGERKKNE